MKYCPHCHSLVLAHCPEVERLRLKQQMSRYPSDKEKYQRLIDAHLGVKPAQPALIEVTNG